MPTKNVKITGVKTAPKDETSKIDATSVNVESTTLDKDTKNNVTNSRSQVKSVKKYEASDLIPVRSITHGELLMRGKKSDILYRWYAYGDLTEVEYQDLYTLKNSRSAYIYKPFFVIENEELLADPRWKEIAELYTHMYNYGELNEIFKLPLKDFQATLAQAPLGLKDAIKMEAADRIDNGTLDSIGKIKAIDAACGTDLICTIQ